MLESSNPRHTPPAPASTISLLLLHVNTLVSTAIARPIHTDGTYQNVGEYPLNGYRYPPTGIMLSSSYYEATQDWSVILTC